MGTAEAQHVIWHPGGGWSVKKEGASRATRHFDAREDAISYARKLSQKHHADVYIHDQDGMVREKVSYQGDSRSSEDDR